MNDNLKYEIKNLISPYVVTIKGITVLTYCRENWRAEWFDGKRQHVISGGKTRREIELAARYIINLK